MADLRQQRTMVWMAMRNLMLQIENGDGVMTRAQMTAFDRLHANLNQIDDKLRTEVKEVPSRAPVAVTAAPAFDVDKFGRSVCSCGYAEECAAWCGNGHETGECPHNMSTLQLLRITQSLAQVKHDYERYKELYATTGDENAMTKMLDCVTME